jgi:hypothetical protein
MDSGGDVGGWQAIIEPVPVPETYFTSVEIIEEPDGMVRLIAFQDRSVGKDGPVERVIVGRGLMSAPCFQRYARRIAEMLRSKGERKSH